MKPNLQSINFFTTYRCNSRCMNCHIWKNAGEPTGLSVLNDETIQALFSDPLFKNASHIGLAGGEPTLSSFFWKLLNHIPEDKHITITTNALNSRRLIEYLKKTKERRQYLVQVSLDGMEEMNDKIRGVPGAFQKTLKLLKELQNAGIDRLISFTINRLNFRELMNCYELAKSCNARFLTRIGYCGGSYANAESRDLFRFDDDELEIISADLECIVHHELQKPEHYPAALVFLNHIVDYYRSQQKDLPCLAMETGVVIDLFGRIFPNCPAFFKSVGNLHDAGFSEIWRCDDAERVRSQIQALACGGCWNDCQVINNIAHEENFLNEEYIKLKVQYFKEKEMPEAIDFGENDVFLMLDGWYDIEGDAHFRYRWTEPAFSILIPPETAFMELIAALPPYSRTGEGADLNVKLDHRESIRLTLSGYGWQNVIIPFKIPVEEIMPCTFELSRCYCPNENKDSSDIRKLGLSIHKITFKK